MKQIILISDSTGELGDRFTNALMTQFPKDRIAFKKFNFVTSEADLRRIFTLIKPAGSVLFHTLIDRGMKKKTEAAARRKRIPAFDLTGPPTEFLIKHLSVKPEWNVSVIHPTNKDYFRRVEAIEFTIEHDDGAGERELAKADIILVGPSRSSKTPTSMYLATKGFKVANIPLVQEIDQTAKFELLRGDKRVFGFVISPEKLCEIRLKRAAELGSSSGRYTEPAAIRKEVAWASGIYRRYGWRTVDVTERAIEETAAILMRQSKFK